MLHIKMIAGLVGLLFGLAYSVSIFGSIIYRMNVMTSHIWLWSGGWRLFLWAFVL